MTPDDLTLFFASNRGDYDIYVATRANTTDNFGTPVNVTAVNTVAEDFPTWISSDGCVLYFTRNVITDGGGSNTDIFVSTRGN